MPFPPKTVAATTIRHWLMIILAFFVLAQAMQNYQAHFIDTHEMVS